MIKVQDLSKNYGDVQAVKSINFEIDDGEIVGFLGENGAGKTTTLKMLTGYLVPTKGNVEINDLNINDSALEIQKQIGYLPELNPLYPEMSVYEYLEFIARVRNITGKSFREALARVVEALDCWRAKSFDRRRQRRMPGFVQQARHDQAKRSVGESYSDKR